MPALQLFSAGVFRRFCGINALKAIFYVRAPSVCNRIAAFSLKVKRNLRARVVNVHDGVASCIDRDRIGLLIRPEGAVHLCIQCAHAAARVRVLDLSAAVAGSRVFVRASHRQIVLIEIICTV